MREFFINLFETRQEPFDVTLYSIWHILYVVTIFAAIIGMAFYLRKKDISTKAVMKRMNRQFYSLAYAALIFLIFLGFGWTGGENLMYNRRPRRILCKRE